MSDPKEMALPGLHGKVRELVSKLKLRKNSRILIVGSGQGAQEKWLIDDGFSNITSMDLYTQNKLASKVNFIKADLNSEFSTLLQGNFDLIIGIEIIEHLNDTYSFLKNLATRLSKNGTILLTSPNVHSRVSRVDFLLTAYPTLFLHKPSIGDHVMPIFYNILEHQCTLNRLKIQKVDHYGSIWTFFKAYDKKSLRSILYLTGLITLYYLLAPLMFVNWKRSKGFVNIFFIKKA